MRYYSNHTAEKLIIILILILIITGVFLGTDIIVSTIGVLLNASLPCIMIMAGIYILIRTLFR